MNKYACSISFQYIQIFHIYVEVYLEVYKYSIFVSAFSLAQLVDGGFT